MCSNIGLYGERKCLQFQAWFETFKMNNGSVFLKRKYFQCPAQLGAIKKDSTLSPSLPRTLLSLDENSRIQFSILQVKSGIWNTSAPKKCFSKSWCIQIQVPSAVLKVLEH